MHFPTTTKVTTTLLSLLVALAKADEPGCTGYQTNPYDIAACANELTARGQELCKVTGGFTTTFCQIGSARIVGVGLGNPSGKEESAPCIDIAVAVGKILDACTHEVVPYGLKASGEMLAPSNENISVHAVAIE